MRIRFSLLLLVLAAAAGCRNLQAVDAPFVKRGEPQRDGDAWVEVAKCGAPAKAGGQLILRADSGSVKVSAGENDRVECSVRLRAFTPSEELARRILDRIELSLRQTEGGGVYMSETRSRGRQRGDRTAVEFQFAVPSHFNLDLDTRGGSVQVSSLEGAVRAHTAGGSIHTGDVSGAVRVETAGGDIDLGNLGGDLIAQTAGGAIHVKNVEGGARLDTSGGLISAGMVSGSFRGETSGGDIVLRGATGPVIVETAGGQIQIGKCGATVHAQTAGGNIRLQGARGSVVAETAAGSIDLLNMESEVRAQTAAGRILAEIQANRESYAASSLESMVGDVQVFLPPTLPLDIRAVIEESFGHRIESDFPLRFDSGDMAFGHGPKRGDANLNGGGKVLVLRTAMGNIEIHKIDAHALQLFKQRQQEFWQRWQELQQQHQLELKPQPPNE